MAELEQDAIVAALVPDSSVGPPSTIVLTGHLGRSPSPDMWRLYLNLALSHYVDIPADKILYTRKLPDDGGTQVWVARGTELQHTAVGPQEAAGFLRGGIVGRHLAEADPVKLAASEIMRAAFERGVNVTPLITAIPYCDPETRSRLTCVQ